MDDSSIETVAEGIADKVIIVADAPFSKQLTEATARHQKNLPSDGDCAKGDPNQILFSSLDISPEVLQAVTDMGFISPSPIQAEAIPPILAGRDVIGQARRVLVKQPRLVFRLLN